MKFVVDEEVHQNNPCGLSCVLNRKKRRHRGHKRICHLSLVFIQFVAGIARTFAEKETLRYPAFSYGDTYFMVGDETTIGSLKE